MCGSSDGAGKRGSQEVNREARCQKSAFQLLHLHQASSSSGWELNPFFSLITFMPAFSFYLHCLSEAIDFRIWVKFSVSLLLWSLLWKRTGEGTERDSWSFEELRKRGRGGVGASDRDGESQRVRRHCTFFFVTTASSICCLLLLLTSPSFPFSITSHLHLLIELFCHWSAHRLGLWSILHLSANDRLLIDERAGQIKQLGQVAGKETERHVFFR